MMKKLLAGLATVTFMFGIARVANALPVYVLHGTEIDSDRLFTIDLTTGVATTVGVLAGSQIEGIAFNPNSGHFFGVDNSNQTLVDISTSPVSWSVAKSLQVQNYTNIARNPVSGFYYTYNRRLFTIDPLTGAVNPVGPANSEATDSLAFDSSGRLFGSGFLGAPSDGALYEIDVLTGAILSSVEITSDLVNPNFDQSLAIHPVTGAFYTVAAIEGGLYQVDPLTGVATRIGRTGLRNIRSLDFAVFDVPSEPDPTPVPVAEPATMLLFGGGIAGLAGTRLRRKKQ